MSRKEYRPPEMEPEPAPGIEPAPAAAARAGPEETGKPEGKVKMKMSGIIRYVPAWKAAEFKEKGFAAV